MSKISTLNLSMLLLNVVENSKKSNGKDAYGFVEEKEWISKANLDEINKEPKRKNYNQYWIRLNREYMVVDTDEEEAYIKLVKFLKEKNLYNEESITMSFRGKTNNIYYKRHFWFKINKKEDFEFIEQEGQIKFKGGEVFFGNGGNIGEFVESTIDNVIIMTPLLFNEIMSLLEGSYRKKDLENKLLKCKESEKITIIYSDTEDEEEYIEQTKNNKKDKKTKTITTTTTNNIEDNLNNDELTQILDGLDKKRFNEYSYWIILYFVFVNEKINLSLFDKYSQKSPKYNKQYNDKILKNIQPKGGYTISTLYFWLKEDNIEVFNNLCKNKRRDFWNLNINHTSIAEFYFQLYPEEYIYTIDGWYEYDNNNICKYIGTDDPVKLTGLGQRLQEIATEQRNFLKPDTDDYKTKTKFYNTFYTSVGQTHNIKQIIVLLKRLYYKDIVDFDNKHYFAFKNILFDSSIDENGNKKNIFRKIKKEDFITTTTNYNLEYEIKNGVIIPIRNNDIINDLNKIIYSLFEDEEIKEYWFNITASSIISKTDEQKIYFLNGKGSNGKSLTQNLIRDSFGSYYGTLGNNYLTGSIKTGGADAELISVKNLKYLCVSEPDETEGKKINCPKLKALSGSDEIKCRGLYSKNMTSFMPKFTLFINTNDLPELSNADDAMRRRIRNIFYPFQFKEKRELNNNVNYRPIDIKLGSKLSKKEYIQNFIILLIDRIYKMDDIIETPLSVLENGNKYINENNTIYDWFIDTIEIDNKNKCKLKASELLEHYNMSSLCKKKLSPKEFHKCLEKLGYTNKLIHKSSYYENFKFKMVCEEDDK